MFYDVNIFKNLFCQLYSMRSNKIHPEIIQVIDINYRLNKRGTKLHVVLIRV